MSEMPVSLVESLAQQYDAQLENDPQRPEVTQEPETPIEEPVQVEEPALSAPQHWAKERQDIFSRAPRDLQQVWLDREKEFDQGITQKSQEAREFKARLDQFETVINPIKNALLSQGMNEYQWMQQMGAYTLALQNDPAGVIRAVANQYGVDLSNLGRGSDEFIDPAIKGLKDEIATLKQQLSQTAQATQTQTLQAQEQVISNFREAKDPQGNAMHPHFDAVSDDILTLAQGYRSRGAEMPTLEDLYQRAVRLHPELQEGDRQKAEQQKKLQSIEAAKRAKGASSRPRDTATDAGNVKPRSLKDQLAQMYDQLAS